MAEIIDFDLPLEEEANGPVYPEAPRTADGSLDWRQVWRNCSEKARNYILTVAKDPTIPVLDAMQAAGGSHSGWQYANRTHWKLNYAGFRELEAELRDDIEFCADFLGKITYLLSMKRLNEILTDPETKRDDFIKASGHVISAIVSPPRHTRARFTKAAAREAAEKSDSEWEKYLK